MKWNAELYDDKHAFVAQYGENVLELLDIKPGDHILDLGCGTGYLSDQIAQKGAVVTGIDNSPEMIKKAEQAYPDLNFGVADASNFSFAEPFDAVFSNAVLHWVKDHDGMMQSVHDNLKPGGKFAAEFGGKGNMAKMIAATTTVMEKYGYHNTGLQKLWYFPSVSEYATRLEAHGFRVTFAAHFDRPTLLQDGRDGVANWLSQFGASFFKGIPADQLKIMFNEITDLLEPDYNKNGQWYADYTRLRFIAVKEIKELKPEVDQEKN